ncbi:MAG TPA: TadE family protein [Gammaproteobacteria bacterium]|nr:TadE family protein [Gammaproteobacteria bacterium]
MNKHSGQSMVEFIIVTPVILLLLFGAFQIALIYHAKTALNYATFEAARFGAVSNARMSEMENAFARGMAAIHTHNPTSDDVMCAREVVYREIESGFVRIQVINPPPEAFEDDELLDASVDDDAVIPNDNLMYRNAIAGSGLTIQDANLLKIRTSYCYPLYVPYINRVLGILLTNDKSESCPGCTGAFTGGQSFERGCLENGRFPIHAQAIVRMQSPAMLSALESGISPHAYREGNEDSLDYDAMDSGNAFLQCGDVDDHEVKETLTPPDITEKTGFWTLNARSKEGEP